jgi:HSP20 family protein
MDRLFESFTQPTTMSWADEFRSPMVDVWEEDNKIKVKAEVPGMSKDDIDITATEDSITLSGEFKHEQEKKEKGYILRERRVGSFYRSIPLPSGIEPDKVKASFKDGLLEITAPTTTHGRSKGTKVAIEE